MNIDFSSKITILSLLILISLIVQTLHIPALLVQSNQFETNAIDLTPHSLGSSLIQQKFTIAYNKIFDNPYPFISLKQIAIQKYSSVQVYIQSNNKTGFQVYANVQSVTLLKIFYMAIDYKNSYVSFIFITRFDISLSPKNISLTQFYAIDLKDQPQIEKLYLTQYYTSGYICNQINFELTIKPYKNNNSQLFFLLKQNGQCSKIWSTLLLINSFKFMHSKYGLQIGFFQLSGNQMYFGSIFNSLTLTKFIVGLTKLFSQEIENNNSQNNILQIKVQTKNTSYQFYAKSGLSESSLLKGHSLKLNNYLCSTSTYKFFNPQTKTCQQNCLDKGYIQDQNKICIKCSPQCYTCDQQSYICTSCDPNSNRRFLKGHCICKDGYFSKKLYPNLSYEGFLYQNIYKAMNSSCIKCDQNCKTCFNSNDNCTSCVQQLNQQIAQNGNQNYCKCKQGFIKDQNTFSCVKTNQTSKKSEQIKCLDKNCEKCLQNSQKCFLCKNEFFLSQNTNNCQYCSQNCLTCSKILDNCTSCDSSLFFQLKPAITSGLGQKFINKKICSCRQGYYLSTITNKCQQCLYTCQSCNGSKEDCLTPKKGFSSLAYNSQQQQYRCHYSCLACLQYDEYVNRSSIIYDQSIPSPIKFYSYCFICKNQVYLTKLFNISIINSRDPSQSNNFQIGVCHGFVPSVQSLKKSGINNDIYLYIGIAFVVTTLIFAALIKTSQFIYLVLTLQNFAILGMVQIGYFQPTNYLLKILQYLLPFNSFSSYLKPLQNNFDNNDLVNGKFYRLFSFIKTGDTISNFLFLGPYLILLFVLWIFLCVYIRSKSTNLNGKVANLDNEVESQNYISNNDQSINERQGKKPEQDSFSINNETTKISLKKSISIKVEEIKIKSKSNQNQSISSQSKNSIQKQNSIKSRSNNQSLENFNKAQKFYSILSILIIFIFQQTFLVLASSFRFSILNQTKNIALLVATSTLVIAFYLIFLIQIFKNLNRRSLINEIFPNFICLIIFLVRRITTVGLIMIPIFYHYTAIISCILLYLLEIAVYRSSISRKDAKNRVIFYKIIEGFILACLIAFYASETIMNRQNISKIVNYVLISLLCIFTSLLYIESFLILYMKYITPYLRGKKVANQAKQSQSLKNKTKTKQKSITSYNSSIAPSDIKTEDYINNSQHNKDLLKTQNSQYNKFNNFETFQNSSSNQNNFEIFSNHSQVSRQISKRYQNGILETQSQCKGSGKKLIPPQKYEHWKLEDLEKKQNKLIFQIQQLSEAAQGSFNGSPDKYHSKNIFNRYLQNKRNKCINFKVKDVIQFKHNDRKQRKLQQKKQDIKTIIALSDRGDHLDEKVKRYFESNYSQRNNYRQTPKKN